MSLPLQPRLRRVESFPTHDSHGQVVFVLRDPEGFSSPIVLPHAATVVASLMDGTRTLEQIQQEFGRQVAIEEIRGLAQELDNRLFLDTDRFRARWKAEIEGYLNRRSRPAAHAGALIRPIRTRCASSSTRSSRTSAVPRAPAEPTAAAPEPTPSRLCGVLSPHIDFHRGGPAFAWAYKRLVEESNADLFVIFGTAHSPMRNLFSVTRKDFETPLGVVETDRKFVARLTKKVAAQPGGADLNLAADELAHRREHSIEFQAVFLQYLLAGKRPFKIVPVLVGSFHEFVATGASPLDSPQVAAFVTAMRQTAAEHAGRVCYISGGDLRASASGLAIGRFWTPRLQEQAANDRELLAAACSADAEGFFRHVAREQDRNRICGLSPTYTMMQVMKPERGELLPTTRQSAARRHELRELRQPGVLWGVGCAAFVAGLCCSRALRARWWCGRPLLWRGRVLRTRLQGRRRIAGLSAGLEDNHSQRRQDDRDRVGAAVPGDRLGHDAGAVAQVAAAVVHRVAVEDFLVPAQLGHAQAVARARHRREVAADHEKSRGSLARRT